MVHLPPNTTGVDIFTGDEYRKILEKRGNKKDKGIDFPIPVIFTTVPQARKILTDAIKADPDFYQGYQANIAMAFFDEYYRHEKKWKSKQDILEIANKAASNFIEMWSAPEYITEPEEEKEISNVR